MKDKIQTLFNAVTVMALIYVEYDYFMKISEAHAKGFIDTWHGFAMMSTISVGLVAVYLVAVDVVRALLK